MPGYRKTKNVDAAKMAKPTKSMMPKMGAEGMPMGAGPMGGATGKVSKPGAGRMAALVGALKKMRGRMKGSGLASQSGSTPPTQGGY